MSSNVANTRCIAERNCVLQKKIIYIVVAELQVIRLY